MRYVSLLLVFALHGIIVFYFLNNRKELPPGTDDASFFTVLILPENKKETVALAKQSYEPINVTRFPVDKVFILDNEKLVIGLPGKPTDVVESERKAPAMVSDTMAPPRIFNRDQVDLASIDKELLAGKPGVPKERPDTPQRRLERGIADAFVGYAESVTDHYTSPDGVVYTRTTKNGRSSCFMSGGSNVIPSIMHNGSGASGAKSVNCPPPDSGWEK